jgi:uncharacterized protein (TIGR04255 family)
MSIERLTFPEVDFERTALNAVICRLQFDPLLRIGFEQTWIFRSGDENWTVSLGQAHVGLETTEYTSFPDFEQRMNHVLTGLGSAYPAVESFSRVGLRYVNVFGRDTFPNADWRTWFNPELLGPMADDDLGDVVSEHQQRFVISEEDWTITVRHGTEPDGGYRLDIDHATNEPVARGAATDLLRDFNNHVYQVFRWTMSEVMLNELGPTPRS